MVRRAFTLIELMVVVVIIGLAWHRHPEVSGEQEADICFADEG